MIFLCIIYTFLGSVFKQCLILNHVIMNNDERVLFVNQNDHGKGYNSKEDILKIVAVSQGASLIKKKKEKRFCHVLNEIISCTIRPHLKSD